MPLPRGGGLLLSSRAALRRASNEPSARAGLIDARISWQPREAGLCRPRQGERHRAVRVGQRQRPGRVPLGDEPHAVQRTGEGELAHALDVTGLLNVVGDAGVGDRGRSRGLKHGPSSTDLPLGRHNPPPHATSHAEVVSMGDTATAATAVAMYAPRANIGCEPGPSTGYLIMVVLRRRSFAS